jgi:hypothetical protein
LVDANISSALKMETTSFFKTLASTNESTQCQNPEDDDDHHHPHCHENTKSHKLTILYGSDDFKGKPTYDILQ